MKKISVNNKQGYLVFNDSRNRGSFMTRVEGVKNNRPWKYIRLFDIWKKHASHGGEKVFRRRKITDYDKDPSKGNGTVTNHTDIVFENIPDICVALMELFREEMGITKAEADLAMKASEEKDFDQLDHLMQKIGGGIG